MGKKHWLPSRFVGGNPGTETAALPDGRGKAVLLECGPDRFGRREMAFHKEQLFGDSDELDDGEVQVGLLDQDPAGGFQDPDQFREGFPLVGKVVEGIDDDDPLESAVEKGELLGAGLNGIEAGLLPGLSEHVFGQVGNDYPAHLRTEGEGNPPRTASRIEEPAADGQPEHHHKIGRLRRAEEAIVGEGYEVEMSVS
jgi:hypothetical protein